MAKQNNPACINLRKRFGDRYKIGWDESRQGREDDARLMILPCRYGHIYPVGGNQLAASVDGFSKVAGRLRRLPCVQVHQDGDFGELTVVFDVAEFDEVARIMHPRRRRQVSDEERDRLRQMGFQNGSEDHVDAQHTPRPCNETPPDDPEHAEGAEGPFPPPEPTK